MTIKHIAMVLEAEGLDGAEKLLLIAYCNRTDDHGYCWPGQQRLADDCGTSIATVKRVKKKLVEKKLIASQRRLDPKTGEPITNLTRVNIELLESMRRPPRSYDDNVIEQITFAADVPRPTKKKKAPKTPKEGSDQVKAQDEPDPVDNTEQGSDQVRAQVEPGAGLNLSPAPDQVEPGSGVKLSPAPDQVDPLTLSHPPENPQRTVHPSVGSKSAGHRAEDGTDGKEADPSVEKKQQYVVQRTEGVDLLLCIGQRRQELLLTGKVLADQGLMIDGLLASGWDPDHLVTALLRPLPEDTRSVGAVMASRVRDLVATPVPRDVQMPTPRGGGNGTADWEQYEQSKAQQFPAVPDREPHLASGAFHGSAAARWENCADCDLPIFTPTATDICAKCLGWPLCEDCNRRVAPGEPCSRCFKVPSQIQFEVCEQHGDRFIKGTGCYQCSVP
ncbi:helix-turn-helix domain-containing protein [Streptomyces sp. NPDC056465]|uniref:helix-turn-helix domain-containing protein n=1 Tax=unclassified Streptomyces TaxID=2593676 RepID=UPI0035E0D383